MDKFFQIEEPNFNLLISNAVRISGSFGHMDCYANAMILKRPNTFSANEPFGYQLT